MMKQSRNLKNTDQIVQVLFQKMSPELILSGQVSYGNFPERLFQKLCRIEMTHLTETEISRLYYYLKEKREPISGENCLNVFRLLKEISRELLLVRNDEPECRYDQLLRWRELSRGLGEDLPVCAFLADRTENHGCVWNDFEWSTVLSHDNVQLKRIMQRGLSDNHFHLFGSAPAFSLCWLKLMNQPVNGRYSAYLRRIEQEKRVFDADFGVKEDLLSGLYMKAAVLRLFIWNYLFRESTGDGYGEDRLEEDRQKVQRFLTDGKLHRWQCKEIQTGINGFRAMAMAENRKNQPDYALLGMRADGVDHDFEGERAILYRMLLGHRNGHPIPDFLMNWFYAYLVIKAKYYRELVQVNDTIGFENFRQYNWRKSAFLFSSQDQERMVRHAVCGSLNTGNIKSLELRISPENTVSKNKNMILQYDAYIRNAGFSDTNGSWYYVFHFPKKAEPGCMGGNDRGRREGLISVCRHQTFRMQLKRMGNILVRFREQAQEQAARVLGIDACSMEVGCRPEVFGPVFRYLSAHVVAPPNLYRVRQWKITYHVGEECLDLADGLRAIDEAIQFLNMESGDRLGHATALGLNVKSWYEVKKNSISLPLQDYLDNVVWLYHKLMEYDISGCETLKSYLRQQYDEAFSQLYGRYLNEDFVDMIEKRLRRGSETLAGEDSNSFRNTFLNFDINTYYAAWKLRGDDPAPYRNDTAVSSRRYPYMINEKLNGGDEIRSRARVVMLYLYYHYSADVRREGAKMKVVSLPDFYIKGVEKVQRAMQQMIVQRGICIESNPSSNYLISTMQSYEQHPISNFYNIGLTMHPEELRSCPQLHVSINTDDKGVFHTSLENEFALMAYSMEHAEDETGEPKYSRQMVYDWLDHIREQGNQQSFLNQ